MLRITFLLALLVFVSCNKKEKLDPEEIKKVVLLQVDYATLEFEGGKEYSYFVNDTSTVQLPVSASVVQPAPNGRITLTYNGLSDTIFDGTQILNGTGERLYPQNIDNQIHYYKLDHLLNKPADAQFQVIFNDLGVAPDFTAIWGGISKLQIVESYRSSNPNSKIGIFLFRPSDGAVNPGDWKWYVLLKG